MAFSHVLHGIKRLNQKHKDQGKNQALQNVLFEMLKREDESIAKRALVTLCDLHRRKVWILEAALQFLLDYEKIEDDDESDASSSEDDATPQKPHVVLSKEDVYKVPPDAVEPLFRQLVNQFVHDRSRSESIAVGLNVVREICLCIPLLMTEELQQDLVLYKKSHDKEVSSAARFLVTLFREVFPSFLVKKDRGRPIDPKARPKAFGEVNVAGNVAGIELLKEDGGDDTDGDDNDPTSDIQANTSGSSEGHENDSDANEDVSDDNAKINSESEDDELEEDDEAPVDEDACSSADEADSVSQAGSSDDMNDDVELHHDSGDEISIGKKRKLSDFDGQLNAVDSSYYLISKLLFKIKTVIV
ncbi:hypothetical protein Droror1_Dr00025532 [Drosera rotundifolia]